MALEPPSSNGGRIQVDKGTTVEKGPLAHLTRVTALDSFLRALGATIGISMLGYLEQRTGECFYGPPYGAAAVLLFGAGRLPQLKAIASTSGIALLSVQLVSLLRLAPWLERGMAIGLSLGVLLLTRLPLYPPAAALALLYSDRARGSALSLRRVVYPALAGHAVLLPFAYAWMHLVAEVLKRQAR